MQKSNLEKANDIIKDLFPNYRLYDIKPSQFKGDNGLLSVTVVKDQTVALNPVYAGFRNELQPGSLNESMLARGLMSIVTINQIDTNKGRFVYLLMLLISDLITQINLANGKIDADNLYIYPLIEVPGNPFYELRIELKKK